MPRRPSICLSRKIGVGALELADMLSERKFFKKAFDLRDAGAYESDRVANRVHPPDLNCAAEIVHRAYECKFK